MIALISDIHGNLEALDAVLADASRFPVDRMVCLGDVIGYGPNPRECLERVRHCEFVLLGNHEYGLVNTADNFNDRARAALYWTREEIGSKAYSKEANLALWNFIDGFAPELVQGDYHFVHGTPRDVTNEYLMPGDALDREKMASIFDAAKARISIGGHTHVPGIFAERAQFVHQSDCGDRIKIPKGRCHINIGSVGQPRDGDPRASYALIDGDEILFRRVRYDVDATMQKILGNPQLDDFLARRLKRGQ